MRVLCIAPSANSGSSYYSITVPKAKVSKPKPRPTPEPFFAAQAHKAHVIVAVTGLRKTADDKGARLKLLHSGDEVTILGSQGKKVKVITPDNVSVYLAKMAVE